MPGRANAPNDDIDSTSSQTAVAAKEFSYTSAAVRHHKEEATQPHEAGPPHSLTNGVKRICLSRQHVEPAGRSLAQLIA